ncbi:DinB family protein [Glutamicibacter arilaitensis]|uniref:DinB family protein n=1 Tax=Glutamicibacter arilaitensis TaxID=256701 RepID=UPI00384B55ED
MVSISPERQDILDLLAEARFFLKYTTRDLSDEQARLRPTSSALCLGGLIKHVTVVEDSWARFVTEGMAAQSVNGKHFAQWGAQEYAIRQAQFEMGADQTLEEIIAAYDECAARTDEVVATVEDLDRRFELPPAPWNEPGASRSVRWSLLHIGSETSQHAGHADIIRESIDGAKSMG